jgi:hypothetical protein
MIVRTERNLMFNPRNGNFKKHSHFEKPIRSGKTKKKFECRTITNPVELMKMGYNPSKKLTPMNDYDMKELMKMVG